VVDREEDGSLEQLWLCPDLPPASDRTWHPVGLEIHYWYADTVKLNDALFALWLAFGNDSVLVAIHRRNGTSRLLVYTAASREAAQARYYNTIRPGIRPPIMGLRIFEQRRWDALTELLSARSVTSEAVDPASVLAEMIETDPR
jgi:hypothetical protein